MIRKLALRTLVREKSRFICLIVAMVLTVVLFSVLFSSLIGIRQASELYRLKQSGTKCHFLVNDWDISNDKLLEEVTKNPMTREAGVRKFLAYVKNQRINYNVEINYEDMAYLQAGFYDLIQGKMPIAENEVIVDTTTLEMLGVPLIEGSVFSIDVLVGERSKKEEFVLVGWFEMNRAYQNKIGQIIVSKEYLSVWGDFFCEDELYGKQELGVVLNDSNDIEVKAERILIDVGADSLIPDIRVNPYYESSMDTISGKGLIAALLTIGGIVLIGYLIINNIFSISALKDAKYYGQLKTVGMERKQISSYMYWQILFLLLISVPAGGVLGYLVGQVTLPAMVRLTSYSSVANEKIFQNNNIMLVIGATILFVVFTACISVLKPIQIIKKMSPIEASRIKEYGKGGNRKSDRTNLYKFAFYNVCRNYRSMFLLIISISLPFFLVIISYNILHSFNLDKYISSVMYSDYIVANDSYFNSEYLSMNGENQPLDYNVVKEIRGCEYIQEDGCVYASCDVTEIDVVCEEDDVWLNIYGLDNINSIKRLIAEDDVSVDCFESGTGVLEGCWLDTDGKMIPGSFQFEKGDLVKLKDADGIIHEFTVLGHIDVSKGGLSTGISNGGVCFEIYFNSDVYMDLMSNQNIMSYYMNIKKEYKNVMDKYLDDIKNDYLGVDYHSKKTYENEFVSLKRLFEIICLFLCSVLSIIAIVNLINVFLTSIIIRDKEIATLRSIGMSRKQLRAMFMYEISYYLIMAFLLSTIISLIVSNYIMVDVCNEISFLVYNVRAEVYLLIVIVAFTVGYITMCIVENSLSRKSITEQLKIL
ncbi:ABC transporter permease [Butyrivibrio sp. MC2013]|uniref:ABC transporter permease n=1 Tax=Butyrivibrio sp. MC2013 TaxID=1280686 RepID=UPI00042479C7|nr:ABC transporter permease [Butyrivibrio sp. MC2013]